MSWSGCDWLRWLLGAALLRVLSTPLFHFALLFSGAGCVSSRLSTAGQQGIGCVFNLVHCYVLPLALGTIGLGTGWGAGQRDSHSSGCRISVSTGVWNSGSSFPSRFGIPIFIGRLARPLGRRSRRISAVADTLSKGVQAVSDLDRPGGSKCSANLACPQFFCWSALSSFRVLLLIFKHRCATAYATTVGSTAGSDRSLPRFSSGPDHYRLD